MLLPALLLLPTLSHSIKWIALRDVVEPWKEPHQCPRGTVQRGKFGLVGYQVKLCKRQTDLMPIMTRAATETQAVCEAVFRDRRWNCSTLHNAPKLAADLTKGTREQAFVYSLSAAAVAHGVAKACSRGAIPWCPCGVLPKTAGDGFRWKGCSDNIEYGIIVSKEWADSPWIKYTRKNRNHNRRQRKKTLLPGGEFVADGVGTVGNKVSLANFMDGDNVLPPRMKMNQHNNDVGRLVGSPSRGRGVSEGVEMVRERREKKCKCHGVSSSCSVKTCWESLPSLVTVGQALKDKYVHATEVKQPARRSSVGRGRAEEAVGGAFETVGMAGKVSHSDLVYIRKSPDYCTQDERVGSLGTKGRECNATSTTHANCDSMCCGRGYETKVEQLVSNCECKYVHCCYVKCKQCTSTLHRHFCN